MHGSYHVSSRCYFSNQEVGILISTPSRHAITRIETMYSDSVRYLENESGGCSNQTLLVVSS